VPLLIEILEEIEAAPRGNARLDVIAKYKDDYSLIRFFQKAVSPAVTFGVKKVDSPYQGCRRNHPGTFAADLFNLALKLEMREWTGNKALQEIEDFLNNCTSTEEKWARRFLQQDLRLDVGAKAFNKAVGFNAIPLFGVPLAEDWNKLKKKPTEGIWEIQPKLDGARTIAYIDFGAQTVELYSRTGKRWGNFKSIEGYLLGFAEQVKTSTGMTGKWVLDGEVLSYVDGKIDFQALQHTMMRKDGVEDGELHYVIFGACPIDDWFSGNRTYSQHYAGINELGGGLRYGTKDCLRIIDILGYVGDCGPDGGPYELQDFGLLDERLAKKCSLAMSMGYEGVMLRRIDAPVELKRSKNLIKYKQFCDSEAKIIGVVEGKGKLTEMVGALVCETSDGKVFEIGTGLDDAERSKLWAMNLVGDLEGKWVSYKYQELTKDGIPRFPVYRSLRSADDFDKE
jgi:hypothetical protein